MIILIDMDDTIEQLLRAWIAGVNKKYGRSARYEEFTDWDVSLAYPGLTREQVYAIPDEPGFWGTVMPIPGAADAMQRLMEAGHEVYIVTATPYIHVPEKMTDLLFRWFPFLSWDQVVITSRKQLIRGDVLIDDGVHNHIGGSYVKLLMTAPHNESFDAEANGMIRVHTWAEIEEVIDRISGQRSVLVTAFEPFGGETLNPSQMVLERLPDEIAGSRVRKLLLPVDHERSRVKALTEYDELSPDAVVMLGQAGGRSSMDIELVARRGAGSLASTLPVEEILRETADLGIACRTSEDAGTYVCNSLFYSMLEHADSKVPAGFIHLPYVREQGHADKPYMELDDMVRAVSAAIRATVGQQGRDDRGAK